MAADVATRYEYDAFISYNRKADGPLAADLHDALHRFAKPWYRLRACRVFRDDDTLGANAGLWLSLEEALAASRFLVLLASRGAANSAWVARELEYWCRERDPGTLIVVATDPDHGDRLVWSETDGDFDWGRTTALPPALRGHFPAEPRIVDLAWARGRDTLTLDDPVFRAAVADIAAPITGRPKDELIGEDVLQHRRAMRWVRAAVAVLAGLLVLAVIAAVIAVRQRDVAQERAAVAEARQYAAQSLGAADPYAALGLAVAAEQRTAEPLPEARAAYAAAVQRAAAWTSRPIAQFNSPSMSHRELAWSPDGSRLRAAADDGSVVGWELSTGEVLPPVAGLEPDPLLGLDDVAWKGESTLAVQSEANGFVLRDLTAAGRPRGPFWAADLVGALAFSPDGTTLAVAVGGAVELWDAAAARLRATLSGGPRSSWRVSWSPDGTRLAVAGEQGLWLWDMPRRRLLASVPSSHGLWSIAWHPSGSLVAVGAEDGGLTMRDGRSGAVRATATIGGGDRVADLAWSPDGSRLAAAGSPEGVRLWALRGAALVPFGSSLRAATDRASRRLAWSPDGRMLADAGGVVGSPELDDARIWQVAAPAPDPLPGLRGGVRTVDWAPGGAHLAANDMTVAIFEPGPGRRWTAEPTTEGITALSWSPRGDGVMALAAGDGVRVARFTGSGLTAGEVLWNSGGAHSLAWSPGGDRLAVGDDRGQVSVRAAAGGERIGPVLPAPGTPDWLFWSPDGATVSAGLTDGRLAGWDPATARATGEPWPVAPGGTRTMAWSPDGSAVAAVARDGSFRVWAVAGHRLRLTLSGAGGDTAALAWSPDGTRLAAGGYDGRIRIWQAAGGALLAETAVGSSGVTALDWSPDGTRIAAGADGGAVTVYTSHPERTACALVRDALELTPQTRALTGTGLAACRAGKIRELPPLPVVAQGRSR